MKFYSEKYMNLVSQPLVGRMETGTERKISMFTDNLDDHFKEK
jgi:hypothetical protein